MMIAAIIAISLALDAFIVWRLKDYAFLPKWVAVAYAILAITINLVFLVYILLLQHKSGAEMHGQMNTLFYFSTFLLPKLVFFIISIWGQLPIVNHTIARPICDSIGLVATMSLLAAIWWGNLVNINKIQVNQIEISSPKIPKGFNGFRIAQISDLHIGSRGNDATFFNKLSTKINSLNPDLIVFTGDLVNGIASETTPFRMPLENMKATYGVHSVLGNHDYGTYVPWRSNEEREANLNSLKDFERSIGWDLMLNESKAICHNGDSIILIGVENWGIRPFPQLGDMSKAYDGLNDSNFKILLSHDPSHWRKKVVPETNIDLTLSGHTHGMQSIVTIFGKKYSFSSLKYKEWCGLYKEGEQILYVNIGAGFIGFKTRIGDALPEITLFTLKHQEQCNQ